MSLGCGISLAGFFLSGYQRLCVQLIIANFLILLKKTFRTRCIIIRRKLLLVVRESYSVCNHLSMGEENILKVFKLSLMEKYYSIKKVQSLVKFTIFKYR